MSQIEELLQQHSQWSAVNTIYHKLKAHGYKAFLAGGCVRDALLGVPAYDLDIATDATPDQIEKLFTKTVNVGKSFGVMRVLEAGQDIEVATFRTDGEYHDGRHPEGVHFSSPEEDAQRRDFTINALFFDLAAKQVLDFVDGQKDLGKKLIRTVGQAEKRFQEDHLRLLRAVRFSAQLNFEIETGTFECIKKMNSLVKSVSGERLRDEWGKLLKSASVEKGLKAAVDTGLMTVLFPFRAQDYSWDKKLFSEPWQLLALFLRRAPQGELAKSLDMLKLSTKERRSIEEAWGTWQKPESLLSLRLGEQLQRLARPGVYYAFCILESESSTPEYRRLRESWQDFGETLPSPYLSGEDVKGQLQGPQIGYCLQEAFSLQLEKTIQSREAALEWLSAHVKGKF
ncbi:CCA-adding enzyme [compost metagenome]